MVLRIILGGRLRFFFSFVSVERPSSRARAQFTGQRGGPGALAENERHTPTIMTCIFLVAKKVSASKLRVHTVGACLYSAVLVYSTTTRDSDNAIAFRCGVQISFLGELCDQICTMSGVLWQGQWVFAAFLCI